jgi:hypothetical protein
MTFHLKGSLKTCVEISRTGRLAAIAHVYHPVTRRTLCDRGLQLNAMWDIHPDDITKNHKTLNNEPEPELETRQERAQREIALAETLTLEQKARARCRMLERLKWSA